MQSTAMRRAAERAWIAEDRLRHERELLALQGTSSALRPALEHAVDTHARAAELQAHAVSLYLRLEALRTSYSSDGQTRPFCATVTVRETELR
jgi:hypothetical protein